MKARKDPTGLWVLSFERGEPLRERVETFAIREGIHGARINAIGAAENPELAYYDLAEKKYLTRVFDGIWELLSGDGNITLNKGKPFMHLHVAISGLDYSVHGGHLMDFTVGVVVEMFVDPLAQPVARRMCDDVGLPTWDLESRD